MSNANEPVEAQLAAAREQIKRNKQLFREILQSGIVDCNCHRACEGNCIYSLVEKASKSEH